MVSLAPILSRGYKHTLSCFSVDRRHVLAQSIDDPTRRCGIKEPHLGAQNPFVEFIIQFRTCSQRSDVSNSEPGSDTYEEETSDGDIDSEIELCRSSKEVCPSRHFRFGHDVEEGSDCRRVLVCTWIVRICPIFDPGIGGDLEELSTTESYSQYDPEE